MNAHTVRSMATLAVVSALLAGCTWVKIPDDARALPLLDAFEVVQCKRLGSITTNAAKTRFGLNSITSLANVP
jgi:hypothetical protein